MPTKMSGSRTAYEGRSRVIDELAEKEKVSIRNDVNRIIFFKKI
jgi:hypothetical protein